MSLLLATGVTLAALAGDAVVTELQHDPAADCVVLLHGMARSARSMRRMAEALAESGYAVVNEGYPSRKHGIAILAPLAIEPALMECRRQREHGRIHFVTHSLGGILLRYFTARHTLDDIGRVVMLGPPNQGSSAADKWRGFPGFGWLNGPAGFELGTGKDSVPRALGKPTFEFAVIAGDRSIDPVTSLMLEGPDDGRVTVAETRLEGMRDFRVVHTSHAFMMRNREVIDLTKAFLANGRFPPVSSEHAK
jgi:triacylglycerol lipase